mmetsp:Transcript_2473/g.5867  ORF Transcript_2473/g.5867 Transcript_2473/m.5867 type:complete len:146 (-) Transcript_2473:108-545(-)
MANIQLGDQLLQQQYPQTFVSSEQFPQQHPGQQYQQPPQQQYPQQQQQQQYPQQQQQDYPQQQQQQYPQQPMVLLHNQLQDALVNPQFQNQHGGYNQHAGYNQLPSPHSPMTVSPSSVSPSASLLPYSQPSATPYQLGARGDLLF